jgi:hypothetical protein
MNASDFAGIRLRRRIAGIQYHSMEVPRGGGKAIRTREVAAGRPIAGSTNIETAARTWKKG